MSSTAPPGRGGAGTTPGEILDAVRRGAAQTRREIARWSGLAPSTVSLRVESLIRTGLIEECGPANQRTGRTPRRLRVRTDNGLVACVVLGSPAADIALADFSGRVVASGTLEVDAADGPDAVLAAVWRRVGALVPAGRYTVSQVAGIALGLPAPVDVERGATSASAQLPGWERVDLPAVLRRHAPIPVVVENDANLLAVAEHAASPAPVRHLLAVKIGDRIGSGIVVSGQLYTGARGAAGEIGHSSTGATSTIACTCTNPGCLESVASGGALVRRLSGDGYRVDGPGALVALVGTGDPHVVGVLREAGRLVGRTLAEVVNVLNPEVVVLGGTLSGLDVHVAALRAELFRACLPVVAEGLDLRIGALGGQAETLGGVRLVLDRILAVHAVNERVSAL